MLKHSNHPYPRSILYTRFKMYPKTIKNILFQPKNSEVYLKKFSADLSQFLNVDQGLIKPCAMARVGIYLIIKQFIKNNKKEIILSPYTISDVVNMVLCAGGVPVFCDTEPATCNIDVPKIENLINKNTAAIMVTHFYGLACDIKLAKSICNKNQIPLIEDAAQAFGVKVDGKYVGTFGDAGIFSFGLYKNVTSFIGGAVVTKDKKLAKLIDIESESFNTYNLFDIMPKIIKGGITDLITHPILFKRIFYKVIKWASINNVKMINDKFKIDTKPTAYYDFPDNYKKKIAPIQLSLVSEQLSKVKYNQNIRIQNANKYFEGLKNLSKYILLPPSLNNDAHGYYYFIIQVPDHKRLEKFMLKEGCDIMVSYHRNCADLDCFKEYFLDCTNARETANSVIYLPTYPSYRDKDIKKNIDTIKLYFAK